MHSTSETGEYQSERKTEPESYSFCDRKNSDFHKWEQYSTALKKEQIGLDVPVSVLAAPVWRISEFLCQKAQRSVRNYSIIISMYSVSSSWSTLQR